MAKHTAAVIATCDYCQCQSSAGTEQAADRFISDHEEAHYNEARRTVLARHGHVITLEGAWMVEDDSGAHVECSCGFVDKEWKQCHMPDRIAAHLAPFSAAHEVEIQAELAQMKEPAKAA